ncbi:MAG: hypothetical protein IAE91_07455 [Ignavibacteriaceae bacterium]|nr:hypothetical protein [Ignavibacteriaceae bacterium]
MRIEEKIILLAALFHDLGRFMQICNTDESENHQLTASSLIDMYFDEFKTILDNENSAVEKLKTLILNHHGDKGEDLLLNALIDADRISSGLKNINGIDEEIVKSDSDSKYLASIFSKVKLNAVVQPVSKFYNIKELEKNKLNDALLPKFKEDLDPVPGKISLTLLDKFKEDLGVILKQFKVGSDFNTLINFLIQLLENYVWCIPAKTGDKFSAVSLFNHLKDTAGLAHSIYLTKGLGQSNKLALIIGDFPGIQKYIFNIRNKKQAKMLRGRSIFVHIITSIAASVLLDKFGVSSASMIMLAGGKFYIIAPYDDNFEQILQSAMSEIENILLKNFNFELQFGCGHFPFSFEELAKGESEFSLIINKASEDLLNGKNKSFKSMFFTNGAVNEDIFVIPGDFIEPDKDDENGTDTVKDAITGKPVLKNRLEFIQDSGKNGENQKYKVDKQVAIEYKLGDKITKGAVVVNYEKIDGTLLIKSVSKLKDTGNTERNRVIVLNANYKLLIDELKAGNGSKFNDALFLDVANFASIDEGDNSVIDFEKLEKYNDGAEYLTLIKGDIDNLGLIMAYGLKSSKLAVPVSAISTMSYQLKYFFSFYLNGFMNNFCKTGLETASTKKNDKFIYTVFAGGDDLMLVTPQSSSVEFLLSLNRRFEEFTALNPEIHISYSLTNFKHNTPVNIVSEFSEENQELIKNGFKTKDVDNKLKYHGDFNKAGVRIFDTNLKVSELNNILLMRETMNKWIEKEQISLAVVRYLYSLSELFKEFEKGIFNKINWHPILTYYINRNVKDKTNGYETEELKNFFDAILKLNKEDEYAQKIKRILMPLTASVIYSERKNRSNDE